MNTIEEITRKVIGITERGDDRDWEPQIISLLTEYMEGLAQKLPEIPECDKECFSCSGYPPCEYRMGQDDYRQTIISFIRSTIHK